MQEKNVGLTMGIDKISVVGNISSMPKALERRTSATGRKGFHVINYHNDDIGYIEPLQYNANQGKGAYRIEFNPNKLDSENMSIISGFLAEMEHCHFSRVDINVDCIGLDTFMKYDMNIPSVKETKIYSGSKSLETHYYGTRSSRVFIRQYDKNAENLAKKGNTITDKNYGRLEFVLKRENIVFWDKVIIDKVSGLNCSDFANLPYKERAILHSIKSGIIDLKEIKSPTTRSKYRKMLSRNVLSDTTYPLREKIIDLVSSERNRINKQLQNYRPI